MRNIKYQFEFGDACNQSRALLVRGAYIVAHCMHVRINLARGGDDDDDTGKREYTSYKN